MSDVERFIHRSVHSPDWLSNIQTELDLTEDPGRRQVLEDQLRRRREALIDYGGGQP